MNMRTKWRKGKRRNLRKVKERARGGREVERRRQRRREGRRDRERNQKCSSVVVYA